MGTLLTTMLIVLFWASVSMVFYTYVLFPLILELLTMGRKLKTEYFKADDNLPVVSILISAFNEEQLIEEKISSIFNTNFPIEKLEVLVGSDGSTDNTNVILSHLETIYPQLKFFPFEGRNGKGNVINKLYQKSKGDILVFTDANVMLEPETLIELVKYFKAPKVGLVDTRMINTNLQAHGISEQEKAYISREVNIKQNESIMWGTMMGPFGGCYAIRKDLYTPVPSNFLVDDFFVNMIVLEKGYQCINNLKARVFEDVSNNLADEFRRKIRIATGNFQNLRRFSGLLFHQTKGLSFCFISHKVIRWIVPFLLIIAFIANFALAFHSEFYLMFFIVHIVLLTVPLIDQALKKLNLHNLVLRLVTHFYAMNLALLIGFFKSLYKIESNVWKPTQRNQS
jgi:cellulose synthase/poly-beta-1,6-N-acetylglucosamine synthase-like glycosyltransferase